MTINERIRSIIEALKMNTRSFSNAIGVDPAVLHNIVSEKGRQSKPSYDILEKILLSFDNINADFLMMGKGDVFNNTQNEMYIKSHQKGGNLISKKGGNLRGNLMDENEDFSEQKPDYGSSTGKGKEYKSVFDDRYESPFFVSDDEKAEYRSLKAEIRNISRYQERLLDRLLDHIHDLESRLYLIEHPEARKEEK